MVKRTVVALIFSLLALLPAGADNAGQSPAFWWSIAPAATIPLGLNASYFSTGMTIDVGGEYANPAWLGFLPFLRADFSYVPLSVSNVGAFYQAAASLGSAYRFSLFGPLSGRVFAGLGYSFVDLIERVTSSTGYFFENNRFAIGGAGLSYAVNPNFALRLDAFYTYYFQLYGSLSVSLGVAFTTSPQQAAPVIGPTERPRLLEMSDVRLASVFPIFHAFYDDHPVGTVSVKNTGSKPITDVRVSFIIKQYMDGPKESPSIPALLPGETREVPLYALFKSTILEVTEPTKVTAEVDTAYTESDGFQNTASATAAMRVYDRNAMTWDDDRKAAAFVSAKDPWVLSVSDNVTAMVRDLRNPGIVKNIQTAIAFHDALQVYGLAYSPNPSTPYSYTSTHPETVDFLKFPRQTLAYRAGDCSDFSILYASLFESVGVQTAFITVPGHILMAIDLDLSEAEAKASVTQWEDLAADRDHDPRQGPARSVAGGRTGVEAEYRGEHGGLLSHPRCLEDLPARGARRGCDSGADPGPGPRQAGVWSGACNIGGSRDCLADCTIERDDSKKRHATGPEQQGHRVCEIRQARAC
jgi:hypothetical protein